MANGSSALLSNTDGDQNVANGAYALSSNTNGSRNVANGPYALYSNTTGNHNVAHGTSALFSNTTGGYNVGVGSSAQYSNTEGNNNISIGAFANNYNQEGSNNTILGYRAGHGNYSHSKSGNVFLGFEAGYSEQGNNKLYIENSDTTAPLIYGEFDNDIVGVNGKLGVGMQAPDHPLHVSENGIASKQTIVALLESSTSKRPTLLFSEGGSSFSNGMSIEYNGMGNGALKELRINKLDGLPMVTFENGGDVGIGTTNPEVRLHIEGGVDTDTTDGGYIVTGSTGGSNISIDNNEIMARNNGGPATLFLNHQGGNVSIGGFSLGARLTIRADAGQEAIWARIGGVTKFKVAENGGALIGLGGTPPANGLEINGVARKPNGGMWSGLSDVNLKRNIRDFNDGLSVIDQLQPVSFQYKPMLSLPSDREYVGLIAQDVEQVAPHMVSDYIAEDGNTYKSIDPSAIIYMLINTVQELEARISELEQR